MPRILVVDDDEVLRVVIERQLTAAGYDVTIATDGRKGLRLLETEEFDLVITDVVMPDMDGLGLLRALRKKPSAPRVVVISGGGRGSTENYLALARSFGAAGTLGKPFTGQQLIDAVARALTAA